MVDNPKSNARTLLEKMNVEKRDVFLLDKNLNDDKIIARIAGGDKTKGSCSSAAFAYVANKGGFDVLDFRGGASCDIFSNRSNVVEIAKLDGVQSKIAKNTNDYKAATELLKTVETGKQYYFATGRHAAIIRKTAEKYFEYLELQNEDFKGFKRLTVERLKNRFNCQKSHTSKYAGKREASSVLIEISSLAKNKEFYELMKYINTAENAQIKGIGGGEK